MQPDQRVVVAIPLSESWDDSGDLPLTKMRNVGRGHVTDLLRQGPVRFVVADCGAPLSWIPSDDAFSFWKTEVRPRLVEPDKAVLGFRLKDYPGEFCYVGTEWCGNGASPVILLEKHH